MKIYLVGGAVRDALLSLPVKEKDYVVVGASVDEMLAQGFQPVGKSFPVFLHPKTKAEYALARTEKKVDKGYHGFTFHAEPNITLEADLKRRDITINAMAQDLETNLIIDPYGGQTDLQAKSLHHVSEAFAEDPVRILRVARFAARYKHLGFSVHPQTTALMCEMVAAGEVDALIPERVWRETYTALCEPDPMIFFEVLRSCGALQVLFPEWDDGIQTMRVLQCATELTSDPMIRFASLIRDPARVKSLCSRLRVPSDFEELAILVASYHAESHRALDANEDQILTLLEHLDAFRRPARLPAFLLACQADNQSRQGFDTKPYPQAELIKGLYQAAADIDAGAIAAQAEPQHIKARIREARLAAMTATRYNPPLNT